MHVIDMLVPKQLGRVMQIILLAGTLLYFILEYSFGTAMLYVAFGATAYLEISQIWDKDKRRKYNELRQQVVSIHVEEIALKRKVSRLMADLVLTIGVSLGAILFVIFAPETQVVLKIFIGFLLLSVLFQTVARIGNFTTVSAYWDKDGQRLIILTPFNSREYPMEDVQEVQLESSPDLLKLHPLFTFFTSNQDFTTSFQKVILLAFPGEKVYLTPTDSVKWSELFHEFERETIGEEEKKVYPIWHPKTLKRLMWKGYFAVTVKGVSAYTALVLLLLVLKVHAWIMILVIILWWLLNLAIADRVLLAGTDAVQVKEGTLFTRAKHIFTKAGVPDTKLYVMDSPLYNGFATGMNIGKGTVILTSATLKLPDNLVDAIIAHEAIHIKKRDVFMNQIERMVMIALLGTGVYFGFEKLQWLAEHYPFAIFIIVYALFFLFPVIMSLLTQWREVRADHLGAALLPNGFKQMADGLREITHSQEEDIDKSFTYQMPKKGKKDKNSISGTERDSWIWRVLEFQFLPHPPMYWRLKSLEQNPGWPQILKIWWKDRWKESFPNRKRVKQ